MSDEAKQSESAIEDADATVVARHKAAIRRTDLSLPAKCLVRDGLVEQGGSFFDFGCGHAEDIRHLKTLGVVADGWDPVHRPHVDRQPSDVVNLGYVLNVIENVEERAATLKSAWPLSRGVLSVAARIIVGGRGKSEVEYGDGVLTRIGTFQKFFTQAELREYIETVLQEEALPAAPGVFYVFRCEDRRQHFLSTRYRRRTAAPRKRASELRFEEHSDILEPLIEWIAERGRVPEADEFPCAQQIAAEFGSFKRAFALIRRVTSAEEWDAIQQKRTEDLLVYLALANFRRRPQFSKLSAALQRDIRTLLGTYKRGCEQADHLLFQAGDADSIDEVCKSSPVGKLLPNALYVHVSALSELHPLLRVYEGCARSYLGEIEGANIIKLHRFSGKVSYLTYPDFEHNPHPSLLRCVKLSMRSLDLNCYDYSASNNPPILHRKESFLASDAPMREKFARLTNQEERYGLFDDTSRIGTRNGWETILEQAGVSFRGHRLIKHKR